MTGRRTSFRGQGRAHKVVQDGEDFRSMQA